MFTINRSVKWCRKNRMSAEGAVIPRSAIHFRTRPLAGSPRCFLAGLEVPGVKFLGDPLGPPSDCQVLSSRITISPGWFPRCRRLRLSFRWP
jgi:hypothetical protein